MSLTHVQQPETTFKGEKGRSTQIIPTYLYNTHTTPSQILHRRLVLPTPILPPFLLPRIPIPLKRRHLLAIHMLGHLIRLPLLERRAQPLVRVVLVVRLILMVLDADEVAIDGIWVQR